MRSWSMYIAAVCFAIFGAKVYSHGHGITVSYGKRTKYIAPHFSASITKSINDSDVWLWYHSCPYLVQNTWIELLNGVFVLICTQTLAGGRAGRLCLGMTKCLGPENHDEAWGEGGCWQEGKCKGGCRLWENRNAAPSSKSVAWRLKSGALCQSSGYCSGRNWARWINSRITRRKPSCRSGLNPTISKNS